MAKLFLVRHGETMWNRQGLYQGQSDIALSPQGARQSERLRDRLASEKIDAIYTSDLKRAMETARIIAAPHNLEVVPSKELQEIGFGEFEGQRFEDIKDRFLPLEKMWRGEDLAASAPGGESLEQLASRLKEFVSKINHHSTQETVLIVSHGGSFRILMCLLLGIGLEHWWKVRLDNAALTIIDTYEFGAIIGLLNDTCHLSGLQ